LLGAKLALFDGPEYERRYPEILGKTRHVPLSEAPRFQEIYVQEMAFPATAK